MSAMYRELFPSCFTPLQCVCRAYSLISTVFKELLVELQLDQVEGLLEGSSLKFDCASFFGIYRTPYCLLYLLHTIHFIALTQNVLHCRP